ncbi:PIN domain-containing protein [Thermus oshimai]|uniref:PIN domain-containing protein n=1 Tax=Thermus oshimai TaxID=56957 RepID=UPI000375FA81|nr:PIN domain-containing protein [Thermus oshimai]
MKVFLDAHVLFSMALGGPVFSTLWEAGKRGRFKLCTSGFCLLEAHRNLEQKAPSALQRWEALLEPIEQVPEARPLPWMMDLLPEKDLPVLAAAVAARATHLLTGDLRHFGPLMGREDLPLRVLTPAAFIRTVRP